MINKSSYKLTIIITLLVMIMLSCEKYPTGPGYNRDNDSLTLIDTICKIDTCYGDTCYACILSKEEEIIYDKMMDAYYKNSHSDLREILDEWSKDYVPEQNIPDSLKDVYAVFTEFYSPWDLPRISRSEFGNNLYANTSYYLIQSRIEYDFDFSPWSSNSYKIDNFKPSITNDTIKVLSHNPTYLSALACFIGNKYRAVHRDDSTIYTPEFTHGNSFARIEFLYPEMQFIHDHWSPTWHYETHPNVFSISFNEAVDSAIVNFKLAYEHCETTLGKKDDMWEVAYFKTTGIE